MLYSSEISSASAPRREELPPPGPDHQPEEEPINPDLLRPADEVALEKLDEALDPKAMNASHELLK